MSQAPKPVWLITYEGTEVTDELAPMVLSADYEDALEDESDSITLSIEDRVGRWRSGWFPSKGDRIALQMGKEGAPLLDCGLFRLDEPELKGPPDTISLTGNATPYDLPLRTVQHQSFEDLTLADLISEFASSLDLTVVGDVAPIRIGRITQQGTTLAFLRQLGKEYGYAFSIRDSQLIFYPIEQLQASPPVLTLGRGDLNSYSFKAQLAKTYAACELTYFDPAEEVNRVVRVEQEHARERVEIASAVASTEGRPLPDRTLRQGATGEDVKWWQTFLQEQGHEPGPIDGIFGSVTRAATMRFQRATGIQVDGIAGPETYRTARETGYLTNTNAAAVRIEASGDVLRIHRRVESAEQAQAQARAALQEANRLASSGSVTIEGSRVAVAGATVELVGMARLSGKYLVEKSKHTVRRSGGYVSRLDVSRV